MRFKALFKDVFFEMSSVSGCDHDYDHDYDYDYDHDCGCGYSLDNAQIDATSPRRL